MTERRTHTPTPTRSRSRSRTSVKRTPSRRSSTPPSHRGAATTSRRLLEKTERLVRLAQRERETREGTARATNPSSSSKRNEGSGNDDGGNDDKFPAKRTRSLSRSASRSRSLGGGDAATSGAPSALAIVPAAAPSTGRSGSGSGSGSASRERMASVGRGRGRSATATASRSRSRSRSTHVKPSMSSPRPSNPSTPLSRSHSLGRDVDEDLLPSRRDKERERRDRGRSLSLTSLRHPHLSRSERRSRWRSQSRGRHDDDGNLSSKKEQPLTRLRPTRSLTPAKRTDRRPSNSLLGGGSAPSNLRKMVGSGGAVSFSSGGSADDRRVGVVARTRSASAGRRRGSGNGSGNGSDSGGAEDMGWIRSNPGSHLQSKSNSNSNWNSISNLNSKFDITKRDTKDITIHDTNNHTDNIASASKQDRSKSSSSSSCKAIVPANNHTDNANNNALSAYASLYASVYASLEELSMESKRLKEKECQKHSSPPPEPSMEMPKKGRTDDAERKEREAKKKQVEAEGEVKKKKKKNPSSSEREQEKVRSGRRPLTSLTTIGRSSSRSQSRSRSEHATCQPTEVTRHETPATTTAIATAASKTTSHSNDNANATATRKNAGGTISVSTVTSLDSTSEASPANRLFVPVPSAVAASAAAAVIATPVEGEIVRGDNDEDDGMDREVDERVHKRRSTVDKDASGGSRSLSRSRSRSHSNSHWQADERPARSRSRSKSRSVVSRPDSKSLSRSGNESTKKHDLSTRDANDSNEDEPPVTTTTISRHSSQHDAPSSSNENEDDDDDANSIDSDCALRHFRGKASGNDNDDDDDDVRRHKKKHHHRRHGSRGNGKAAAKKDTKGDDECFPQLFVTVSKPKSSRSTHRSGVIDGTKRMTRSAMEEDSHRCSGSHGGSGGNIVKNRNNREIRRTTPRDESRVTRESRSKYEYNHPYDRGTSKDARSGRGNGRDPFHLHVHDKSFTTSSRDAPQDAPARRRDATPPKTHRAIPSRRAPSPSPPDPPSLASHRSRIPSDMQISSSGTTATVSTMTESMPFPPGYDDDYSRYPNHHVDANAVAGNNNHGVFAPPPPPPAPPKLTPRWSSGRSASKNSNTPKSTPRPSPSSSRAESPRRQPQHQPQPQPQPQQQQQQQQQQHSDRMLNRSSDSFHDHQLTEFETVPSAKDPYQVTNHRPYHTDREFNRSDSWNTASSSTHQGRRSSRVQHGRDWDPMWSGGLASNPDNDNIDLGSGAREREKDDEINELKDKIAMLERQLGQLPMGASTSSLDKGVAIAEALAVAKRVRHSHRGELEASRSHDGEAEVGQSFYFARELKTDDFLAKSWDGHDMDSTAQHPRRTSLKDALNAINVHLDKHEAERNRRSFSSSSSLLSRRPRGSDRQELENKLNGLIQEVQKLSNNAPLSSSDERHIHLSSGCDDGFRGSISRDTWHNHSRHSKRSISTSNTASTSKSSSMDSSFYEGGFSRDSANRPSSSRKSTTKSTFTTDSFFSDAAFVVDSEHTDNSNHERDRSLSPIPATIRRKSSCTASNLTLSFGSGLDRVANADEHTECGYLTTMMSKRDFPSFHSDVAVRKRQVKRKKSRSSTKTSGGPTNGTSFLSEATVKTGNQREME